MDYISVREAASKVNKNEETIKRWIRKGLLVNVIKYSDKEGWKISESELEEFMKEKIPTKEQKTLPNEVTNNLQEVRETIELAYNVALLRTPSEEMLKLLTDIGLRRTLEILLIMRQSTNPIKNPVGFIKKAIIENWAPQDTHQEMTPLIRKQTNEMTQIDYEKINKNEPSVPKVTFYNWLEERE